jgi:hypothetical protein
MKPRTDIQQAVKHASWPRSVQNSDGIPNTRFTPTHTFVVPYWGLSDEWGSKDVPVLTPCSASSRSLDRSSKPQADITLSRRKTTPDTEETSGLSCHAGSGESVDPAHEIWRKIDLRESPDDERGGRSRNNSKI